MFVRSLLRAALGAACFTLIIACGSTGVTDDPGVHSVRERIAGGYAATADSAVVGILNVVSGFGCSGTLIAPNLVLTARHCVSSLSNVEKGIECDKATVDGLLPETQFAVTTTPTLSHDSSEYHHIKEVIGLPIDSTLYCGNDMAMLVVSENIDPTEAKPIIPRVDVPVVTNEHYSAIGFGVDEQDQGGGIRRRRDELSVVCPYDQCPFFAQLSLKATEWMGNAGLCNGDSGGPAIDQKSRVIGVASRGLSGCSSPIYGDVFKWAKWVKETAVHAAKAGGYEAPAWSQGWPTDPAYNGPIGDACQRDSDCEPSRCVDGYCTRACSKLAPCPKDYDCNSDQNICLRPPEPEPPAPVGNADSSSESSGCAFAGRRTGESNNGSNLLAIAAVAIAAARRRRR